VSTEDSERHYCTCRCAPWRSCPRAEWTDILEGICGGSLVPSKRQSTVTAKECHKFQRDSVAFRPTTTNPAYPLNAPVGKCALLATSLAIFSISLCKRNAKECRHRGRRSTRWPSVCFDAYDAGAGAHSPCSQGTGSLSGLVPNSSGLTDSRSRPVQPGCF